MAAKRLLVSESTVTFSQKAHKDAKLAEAGIRRGDVESVRKFLSKIDLRAISPNDLGKVVGRHCKLPI